MDAPAKSSEIALARTFGGAQSTRPRTIPSNIDKDTIPSKTPKLPIIVFREGDKELKVFPPRLREQLVTHITNHGPMLLWGVARKCKNADLFLVNGSFRAHFRAAGTNEKLLAARYRYGSEFEITVVKERSGTSIEKGQPVLITYGGMLKQAIAAGTRYKRSQYIVWDPDHDVTTNGKEAQIRRYIEADQRRNEPTESDDSDSVLYNAPRSLTFRLPLEFTKIEGDLQAQFPAYLKEDIVQFLKANPTKRPSCARARSAGRELFSTDDKLVQYRETTTNEILLAARYECQSRHLDVVRASGDSSFFDGKSVLIGESAKERKVAKLDDNSVANISFYYIWNSSGRSAEPRIAKWTFQSTKDDPSTGSHPLPVRQKQTSISAVSADKQRRTDIVNIDFRGSSVVSDRNANLPNVASSAEPRVPNYTFVESPIQYDEHTDNESEDHKITEEPSAPYQKTRAKHQRDRSGSDSSAFSKRRRGNDSGEWKRLYNEESMLGQKKDVTARSRDVVTATAAAGFDYQPNTFHRSLGTTRRISLTGIASDTPLSAEPELDHFFVFKQNVVDEEQYPVKSFRICNDVFLLFQHGIKAGIADKTTTLLMLQSRSKKWSVVRGDPDDFDDVLNWLKEARESQRIVVTPDIDW